MNSSSFPAHNFPLRYRKGVLLVSVSFSAAAVIAFQITLIRAFSVINYYHFSYLAISTALLGFAASGTFLTIFRRWFRQSPLSRFTLFYLLFILSLPLGYLAAHYLPLDIQYLLYRPLQFLILLFYIFLLFIPFFCGGVILGFTLIFLKGMLPVVYGANLLGSGLGGLGALGLLFLSPPSQAPLQTVLLAFLGFLFWTGGIPRYFEPRERLKTSLYLLSALAITVWAFFAHPSIPIDPFKALYRFQTLSSQQDAVKRLTRFDPYSRIDVYDSPVLHQTLFAALSTPILPPSQLAILRDGEFLGSIFKIQTEKQAAILDYTPQALVYVLQAKPAVLLLGEVGGTNIWLAKRFQASAIAAVQEDKKLIELLSGQLAGESGRMGSWPELSFIQKTPRLFVEQSDALFDIIQFCSLEALPAGSGGLYSLYEDHMLTVEAISTCLSRLTEKGVISITRGIQSPPRDNIKIFATALQALKSAAIPKPQDHLILGRNYLAASCLISREPFSPLQLQAVLEKAKQLDMDLDYYPGISEEPTEQINLIPGPGDSEYSYYRFAIQKLIEGKEQALYQSWIYKVNPATDNSPYFHNFFRLSAVNRFQEIYGRNWIRQLELGYVVLLISLLGILLLGIILILLPLAYLRYRLRGRYFTKLLYFTILGTGFMFLEMLFIQKFTLYLESPVYGAAAVITTILVCAGIGSISQRALGLSPSVRIRWASVIVAAFILLYSWAINPLLKLFTSAPLGGRYALVVLILSPLSFFLGWFFSSGLELLENHNPQLIPLAWGINGLASVFATPLALLLFISWGITQVSGIALFLYLLAGLLATTFRTNAHQ